MKVSDLTVQEVASILTSIHVISGKHNQNLQRELAVKANVPYQEPDQRLSEVSEKLAEEVYLIIAERFVNGDPSKDLISTVEFSVMADLVYDEYADSITDMDDEEKILLKHYLRGVIQNLPAFLAGFDTGGDSISAYRNTEKKLIALLEFAEENHLSPVVAATTAGIGDEITRRTMTRDEYLTKTEKLTGKFLDPDMLIDLLFKPMAEAEGLSEEEAKMMIKSVKEAILPQLTEPLIEMKANMSNMLQSEADRIYGEAA